MHSNPVVVIAVLSLFAASAAAAAAAAGVLDDTAVLGMQENELLDTDFVFNLATSAPIASGAGGEQRAMTRDKLKGLRLRNGAYGGGGDQVMFTFKPCGFRTPHFHPRGTENFHVLSGNIAANLIRENGSLVSNHITKGVSGFFPVAHFHFLQNIGCEEASVLVMFDNSDVGVIEAAFSLRFPFDTIQGALGNFDLVARDELIRDRLQQSKACLKRCGLDYEKPVVYTDYPKTTTYRSTSKPY
jgi:oxalate decarboxylase/phosphoglucose isomerase-like protein (cupin superfamily)